MEVENVKGHVKINHNEKTKGGKPNGKAEKAESAKKTDTVQLSQKSVALANAAKVGNGSNGAAAQKVSALVPMSKFNVVEMNKQVSASVKAHKKAENQVLDISELRLRTKELSQAANGLSNLGMNTEAISKIVQKANTKTNEIFGRKLSQAYKGFRARKINIQEFKNKLHGAVFKKLNSMFSGTDGVFGKQSLSGRNGGFGLKLGMVQVNQNTIRQLFDGETNVSGGNINRIGNGFGSDDSSRTTSFNATHFMSLLSDGINSALDMYKEVQDITAQKSETESTDDGTLA